MAVPAKSLSALRRLIEPSASALASSSKERLVDSWLTCCLHSPKGGTRGSPAQLYNEDKYEGLQSLAQLPRIPTRRSSRLRDRPLRPTPIEPATPEEGCPYRRVSCFLCTA